MQVREITKSDIESISKLHKKVFDSSYFSIHYSITMLNKYFENLLDMNDYNYLAENENLETLGFLIGGFQTQKAVDEFMRKNKLYIICSMLRKPKFIVSGIKKILSRFLLNKQKSAAKLRLFLIGVDPDSNRNGIGSLLINRFEKDLQTQGIHQYGLYVRINNYHAINFYERKGFKLEFSRDDLSCYIKKI